MSAGAFLTAIFHPLLSHSVAVTLMRTGANCAYRSIQLADSIVKQHSSLKSDAIQSLNFRPFVSKIR